MGNDTILRPMLELSVIIPAAILCYLPMKGHLDGKGRQIALWGIPVLLLWVCVGGAVCYRFRWDTNLWMLPSLALFALFYCRTITLSYWKTVSVFGGLRDVFHFEKSGSPGGRPAFAQKRPCGFFFGRGGCLCPVLLDAAGAYVVSGHPCRKMASG